MASGRADDARLILDRTAVGGSLRLPHDNLWLGATALYAGVAASTGHIEQRDLLRQSLRPFADQWCVFGAGGAVFGTGHHWLGRLAIADGDREGARSHLERAVTMSEDAGARLVDRDRTERSRADQLAVIVPPMPLDARRIATVGITRGADVDTRAAGRETCAP